MIEPRVQDPWTARYEENGYPPALHSLLISQGLISDGPNYFGRTFRLTPTGEKEAVDLHWKCTFNRLRGVVVTASCAIPVMQKIDVEVTGIQFSGTTTALVAYKIGIP